MKETEVIFSLLSSVLLVIKSSAVSAAIAPTALLPQGGRKAPKQTKPPQMLNYFHALLGRRALAWPRTLTRCICQPPPRPAPGLPHSGYLPPLCFLKAFFQPGGGAALVSWQFYSIMFKSHEII